MADLQICQELKFSLELSHENISTAMDIENVDPLVLKTHIKGFRYIVQGVSRAMSKTLPLSAIMIMMANDEVLSTEGKQIHPNQISLYQDNQLYMVSLNHRIYT